MKIEEITKLLNIPYSTFKDWNTVVNNKYDLTILLLGLDANTAKSIIKKEKKILKNKPKYKITTRKVVLQKNWFDSDLFWTSSNNEKLDIKNITTVYMDRAIQVNTDKLCELFGYDRVKEIVSKYIVNKLNRQEALRQLDYYRHKIFHITFKLTHKELENNYLKTPRQRVVDYYCNSLGTDKVLEDINNLQFTKHKKLQLKKMIEYYKRELLNDTTIKISA